MSDAYIGSVIKELRKLVSKKAKLFVEIDKIEGKLLGLQCAAQLFYEHSDESIPAELQSLGIIPKSSGGQVGSKWQVVLSILEDASPKGLSCAEIIEHAKMKNIQVNPRTVSSQLSNAKTKGVVSISDGNYFYPPKKDLPSNDDHNETNNVSDDSDEIPF